MIIRIEVVLPAPLGPSRPKITPRGTRKERPSTARKRPNDLVTSWSSIVWSMGYLYLRLGRKGVYNRRLRWLGNLALGPVARLRLAPGTPRCASAPATRVAVNSPRAGASPAPTLRSLVASRAKDPARSILVSRQWFCRSRRAESPRGQRRTSARRGSGGAARDQADGRGPLAEPSAGGGPPFLRAVVMKGGRPVRSRASRSDGTGGEGGIRTLETLSGLPVFETGLINHSSTSPRRGRNGSRGSEARESGTSDGQEPPLTLPRRA